MLRIYIEMVKVKIADLSETSKLPPNIFENLMGDLFNFSKSKEELFLRKNTIALSPVQVAKFKKYEKEIVERGVPYQYAIKKSYFYGREFYIDENVLIPRPETELLVKSALNYITQKTTGVFTTSRRSTRSGRVKSGRLEIIDIGTGSGCIAVSLVIETAKRKAKNLKLKIYATDVSEKTLKVARKNAKLHKVKIIFLKSDLLSNPKLPKKFDLILANLPYLPSTDITSKHPICHEPRVALDGGQDGLDLIKKLITKLPEQFTQNGLAILEIDPRQKTEIASFTKKQKLKIEFKKDLANRTRLAIITE